MWRNGYLGTTEGNDVLNAVWAKQQEAMIACVTLWFTEPYELIYMFYLLFYNIWIYLWYNLTWSWLVIDATFGFTTDGVIYAFTQIFDFFYWMVTDYEGFVETMQD
jgi:hypothetical protein